ncbi:anthranilate synthase component 1 [Neolewinella xylanilytica]|uniref:Anthranilate synthase component 1 n=1 Tax=Neolewinella xylanilytica TaxID=1514080 RepID=A0A2S6I522_9BACT|nr:anthranilate synthase component I family protein [Neolewinella xylanilytica]PPK86274.1 anthranilate synthase component 1 [Neolewinella xylanilytica]
MSTTTLASEQTALTVRSRRLTADQLTPVSLYLALRDRFTDPVLLESNETRNHEHYFSIIGLETLAFYRVEDGRIHRGRVGQTIRELPCTDADTVSDDLSAYLKSFAIDYGDTPQLVRQFNGLIGHTNFEGVAYFDTLSFRNPSRLRSPALRYHLYRFVLVFHHYRDELLLIENLPDGETSRLDEVERCIRAGGTVHPFTPRGESTSNMTDDDFKALVAKGKHHCRIGDVFQIVLSRQFRQEFHGDEFQVYRALRSINPSPYLFYFDYGDYRIMGSSPESQMVIRDGVARLNPIAGTYRRTGDADQDREATERLLADPKENAEHVMLVDLARNDLSRHTREVTVRSLREVHYYSHVIHLVSTVDGKLEADDVAVRVFGDTFPAGTLSGAPKYRAIELIDQYEKQQRGFYGGAIGFIDFEGGMNQAILIRSFFSQDNALHYQAGAGVVAASNEESEMQEVYNKLGALTKAIAKAETLPASF